MESTYNKYLINKIKKSIKLIQLLEIYLKNVHNLDNNIIYIIINYLTKTKKRNFLILNSVILNDIETVILYYNNQLNFEIKDYNGNTILHIATQHKRFEIVEKLLKIGIDFEIKNNNGETPLYIASNNGHFRIVILLLEFGANINTKNNKNQFALQYKKKNYNLYIIKLRKTNKKSYTTCNNRYYHVNIYPKLFNNYYLGNYYRPTKYINYFTPFD